MVNHVSTMVKASPKGNSFYCLISVNDGEFKRIKRKGMTRFFSDFDEAIEFVEKEADKILKRLR